MHLTFEELIICFVSFTTAYCLFAWLKIHLMCIAVSLLNLPEFKARRIKPVLQQNIYSYSVCYDVIVVNEQPHPYQQPTSDISGLRVKRAMSRHSRNLKVGSAILFSYFY